VYCSTECIICSLVLLYHWEAFSASCIQFTDSFPDIHLHMHFISVYMSAAAVGTSMKHPLPKMYICCNPSKIFFFWGGGVRSHFCVKRQLASSFPSVRVSPCIGADSTGRISVKFDNGDVYQKMARKYRFGKNRTKILDRLHEDLSAFYCCRRHKYAIRALLCNTQCCWQ
jgi:hypothetical protein